MLETLFKTERKLKKVRTCWLYESIDRYLTDRSLQKYSPSTLGNEAHLLFQFAFFVQDQGITQRSDLSPWVEPFVERHSNLYRRRAFRGAIHRLIRHLRGESGVPCPRNPAPRFFKYVSMYQRFLNESRGLTETHVAAIGKYCVRFLHAVHQAGVTKIHRLNRKAIQDFFLAEGNRCQRQTLIHYCSMVRGFLSYLYACRVVPSDLSGVVIPPPGFHHERCSRFMTAPTIQTVLSAVDRRTRVGRRNYAMLLLLATYGLRGIEITRLRLEDIDWRGEILHIRTRKSKNHSIYPLVPSVGNAILSYLKKGRPSTSHRQVFVHAQRPYGPLTTTAVRHVLKKYVRRAGLPTARAGAHTLRYSCAQRLFEEDFSIKVIGDYLGHRNLETTRRYMKIDLKHLRDVGINDGEDLL